MVKEKEEKEEKSEEEKKKEEEAEEVEEDVSEDLISKANAAAIRIEEANKETTKLLMKQEAMKVQETLSGKTEAGTPETTSEQKEQAKANKFLEGTGMDPFEDDKPNK